MTKGKLFCGVVAATFVFGAATAQDKASEQDVAPVEEVSAEPVQDEIADRLNSQQQLKQTFTLERRINGELVETQKRTITYSRGDPLYETEAALSPIEALRAQFEAELLTRREALEEAKLFFSLADQDRDDTINADEFSATMLDWSVNNSQVEHIPYEEESSESRIQDFIAELDKEVAQELILRQAKQKFAFMAGASSTITQTEFIREYLLDFDSMDKDGDTLLKDNELLRFRMINRGGVIEIPAG